MGGVEHRGILLQMGYAVNVQAKRGSSARRGDRRCSRGSSPIEGEKALLRTYLKSRLGPLRITEVAEGGEPGIQLDSELLAAAQIMPGEQVRLALGSGVQFVAFAAPAKRGTGAVRLTGLRISEAERAAPLWIWTECTLVDREALAHEPRETRVDGENHALPAED